MFNGFKKVFGNVTIRLTDKYIFVEGISANTIERDIRKIWKTNKINEHMFHHIGTYSFSFCHWFAPEIVYALEKITEYRNRWTDIKTLNKIKDKLLTETWLANTSRTDFNRVDFSKLENMAYPPLHYQMDFLKYYDKAIDQYKLRGALLNGGVGTGKTFSCLALSECLNSDLVIVIAPANSLDRVWKHNINTVFKTVPTHWISSEGKPYNGEKFIVMNYEFMTKFLDIIPKLKNGKVMMILDESHNLNELSAARSNLFLDICIRLKVSDVIEASGTPVKAVGNETIPLFRAIDTLFTDEVEASFLKIFGKAANTALDMLNHRLGLVSFRIDKKELKLAEPIVETIKIKIPNSKDYTLESISNDLRKYKDERMAYYATRKKSDTEFYLSCIEHHKKSLKSTKDFNDLKMYQAYITLIKNTPVRMLYEVKLELDYCNKYEKNNIIPSLESHTRLDFKESKTLYKYTILKVQGECLGRILGRKRIDCHMDMIEYIDFKGICNSTTKKTLVFTSYVDVLEKTKKYLQTLDMNPLVVYGKTNSELTPIIKSFESNESLNPLVATFQSLSTAVPMIMADTMIMINAPFRDYIYTQTVGRINRLGADTQAYVYMVSLDTGDIPNISNRSIDILEWSQQQVALITGVGSNFEVNESLENYKVSISNETFDISEEVADVKRYKVSNEQFLNW